MVRELLLLFIWACSFEAALGLLKTCLSGRRVSSPQRLGSTLFESRPVLLRRYAKARFEDLTSSSRFPLFPTSLKAISAEAARAVARAEEDGAHRLLVEMRLPSRPSLQHRQEAVQQIDPTAIFERRVDLGSGEESPTLLLAVFKLATELAKLGRPRVRFVVQNVQAAMRMRQVIHYHQRSSSSPSSAFRLSILGMNTTSAGLHFGLAMDDDVILVVAPSTEQTRDVAGPAGISVLAALDDLFGAATNPKINQQRSLSNPKTVVMINSLLIRRSRYGESCPYSLRSFLMAFYIDPCYATMSFLPDATVAQYLEQRRRGHDVDEKDQEQQPCQPQPQPRRRTDEQNLKKGPPSVKKKHSCGLLRSHPFNWELYRCESPVHDAMGAYVFLKEFEKQPSTSSAACLLGPAE